ncbi:MAG: DUF1801 domain-containing protein [Bacteroidetes bacterium]|nr:DUF1801 domain-containing protein [Bacteroidota bacterium]
MEKPLNFEAYISTFPESTQQLLEQIRAVVMETAPGAIEVISYGMPGFKFHGMLVWFAAYSRHIGFYPTGSGIAAFKHELTGYQVSKGTVQFPLDKPIPLDLVRKMVAYRVNENLEKVKSKKK